MICRQMESISSVITLNYENFVTFKVDRYRANALQILRVTER